MFGRETACCAVLLLSSVSCVGSIVEGDEREAMEGMSDTPGGRPAMPTMSGPLPDNGLERASSPAGVRRLTRTQYQNAVRALLGDAMAATTTGQELDDDVMDFEFSSQGAYQVTTSPNGVEKYRAMAFEIANQAFSTPQAAQALLGCQPSTVEDACVQGFLRDFGRRVFRRPLTAEEITDYKSLVGRAAAEQQGNVSGALKFALAAMLQDPNFLYFAEVGEPDPLDKTRLRFTTYEMASRLSLFLGNTIPDRELLDAAERGLLLTPDGLRAQVERMLGSDSWRAGLSRFFAEYLRFDGLEDVTRDKQLFPRFDAGLMAGMKGEMERVLNDFAIGPQRDLRDLFVTRETQVNRPLATLYGLAGGTASSEFQKVELPATGPRAGFLTMAGFLTATSNATRTSATNRGVFVRERLLCQHVPPPPEDADTALDVTSASAGRTMRERLEQHRKNQVCAGCHQFFDPIGLSLEQFDAIGAHRPQENGATIDVRADVDGKAFNGARELGALLRDDPRPMACATAALFRYANGREEREGDKGGLDRLKTSFAGGGYRFRSLLLDLVTSPGFRYTAKPL